MMDLCESDANLAHIASLRQASQGSIARHLKKKSEREREGCVYWQGSTVPSVLPIKKYHKCRALGLKNLQGGGRGLALLKCAPLVPVSKRAS